MKIYITSSWKNKHAIEMLTLLLRAKNFKVLSFVENSGGAEHPDFDQWIKTDSATENFRYDTDGATQSDLVIYLGPSGLDVWAKVGAAWGAGVPVLGLWAKGEQVDLLRKMVEWYDHVDALLKRVQQIRESGGVGG